MGSTGSGKTTTVDIILGLLESQKGQLEVDNKIINKYNIGGKFTRRYKKRFTRNLRNQ